MTSLYNKLQQIVEEYENEYSLLVPPILHEILIRFKDNQDEVLLTIVLRQFLSDQDAHNNSNHNFRFDFPVQVFDLCIRIAEEIVEENEPIISLIKKSLDPNIKYMDESFLAITLQELTEYRDDQNKRRLRKLSHFGLSDDGTVLISYLRSCEVAVIMEQGVFCDQTVVSRPLSASEQARLLKWQDGFGSECVDYCTSEALWVTDNFFKNTRQENTFLYELSLLQECLLNAGITRNNQESHDLDSGKIAEIGIRRFYNVWNSLPQQERESLISLTFDHYGFQLVLGPVLYRIFCGVEGLSNLDPKIIAITKTEPYIRYSCVEVQAEIIGFAQSKYASQMQQIMLSPQPPIKKLKEVIDRKEALTIKLMFLRALIERLYYYTFADFIEGIRKVSKKNKVAYCMAVGWDRINNLIKTKEKSDLMQFMKELFQELPNEYVFEVFKEIDRNVFSILTPNDLKKLTVILHVCEVAGTSREFKLRDDFTRKVLMRDDILVMKNRVLYHLGIEILLSIISNNQAKCEREYLFFSIVEIFRDAINTMYKTKKLFEMIHALDLKNHHYIEVSEHFYLLVKYQKEWQRKFNIPIFNHDSDVLAYIVRIFQEIVGMSKFLSGHWRTRGDNYALRIIGECNKNITLPQMMEYLISELQDLMDPASVEPAPNGPSPFGGTAMRMLHCLHVVACHIHGLEQKPKKDLLSPGLMGSTPVATLS